MLYMNNLDIRSRQKKQHSLEMFQLEISEIIKTAFGNHLNVTECKILRHCSRNLEERKNSCVFA